MGETHGRLGFATGFHPGHRNYRAPDIRDAELARLLSQGGYLLNHIATVADLAAPAGKAYRNRPPPDAAA